MWDIHVYPLYLGDLPVSWARFPAVQPCCLCVHRLCVQYVSPFWSTSLHPRVEGVQLSLFLSH